MYTPICMDTPESVLPENAGLFACPVAQGKIVGDLAAALYTSLGSAGTPSQEGIPSSSTKGSQFWKCSHRQDGNLGATKVAAE